MADDTEASRVLYVPASPNVGAADPDDDSDNPKQSVKDRARADDLAEKVAIGDELSAYEKVAGRGVVRE